MDTDEWLAQYKDRVAGIKQAAADLEENIAAATVTVSSPDESVTVTIGPNGSLRDLRFSHRASEHSHAELAALVMKTVAKGQRAVADKVVSAFAPIGAGTSAMELLTKYAPPDEPDEQPAPNAYDQLAADAPPAPAPPAATSPPPAPAVPAPVPVPAVAARRPTRPVADDSDEFDERPW